MHMNQNIFTAQTYTVVKWKKEEHIETDGEGIEKGVLWEVHVNFHLR